MASLGVGELDLIPDLEGAATAGGTGRFGHVTSLPAIRRGYGHGGARRGAARGTGPAGRAAGSGQEGVRAIAATKARSTSVVARTP
ncbi:hypothetical protein GCM10010324_52960 [Streptomyces hiroshimensis]|uniref:Uncharacterized protein n=1 Tax=Streptomyces hiroshimensis TaxID=66424 RepID=A0ABQ2Z2J4_9ACTN|nr:hypothetical protein GCM10010324_52960 [Streptomyces hiroshimensis]